MSPHPSAAVLVLNYNGLEHLQACLPSLAGLTYPNTRIVVVDNGSHDGSLDFVRRAHPETEVIALGTNRGFAGAYNDAIRMVDTEWVVLLNNDTRVDRRWLDELIAGADRHGAAAAAAAILDWDGSRIDYAGGVAAFTGHGWQVDHAQAVGRQYTEGPVLFGCGGAVMFRRAVYLDRGGFDEDYFMYFEDVDLGWRLNVMGYPTVFVPSAITYHRLHGTTGHLTSALKLRLYERNALATIFKNLDDDGLARILPAAVALTIARSLTQADLDETLVTFKRKAPDRAVIPPQLASGLIALEDFARWLPRLREKRAFVQSRRMVQDTEVHTLMREPLRLHDLGDRYQEIAETLIHDFQIAELFGLIPPPIRLAVSGIAATPPSSPDRAEPSVYVGPDGNHPLVSIIVLTASGEEHLPECLDSLRRQDWPSDRLDVIVVDNGPDGLPMTAVAAHFPAARIIRTGRNLGFSGGNNAGAAVARGDWLLFLNDDTRAEPTLVSRLMEVAVRRQAASVGARILDWTGRRIDFAGGLVNFEGRGYPLGWDQDAATFAVFEQPLLFACGAAALFRREIFERAGRWDEPTFAYYEDVEFGWRLWLLGHDVWFAPDAVVYHKHHGTAGHESPARLRAFERNALRMIYALAEERTLQQALSASLLLALDRTVLGTGFSRAAEAEPGTSRPAALGYRLRPSVIGGRMRRALSRRGGRRALGAVENIRRIGAAGLAAVGKEAVRDILVGWDVSPTRDRFLIEHPSAATAAGLPETVPISVVAALLGIQDFLQMLPGLSERRAWLQARRQRSDAEIIGQFGGHWRSAVPSPHLALHRELRAGLLDVLARTLGALPGPLDLRDAS
jgi:GT2 family glycosyltransferase